MKRREFLKLLSIAGVITPTLSVPVEEIPKTKPQGTAIVNGYGLFSNGQLISYNQFSDIYLDPGDTLQTTWEYKSD